MTQNRKQTKAIRRRIEETEEAFMQARRQLEMPPQAERPTTYLEQTHGRPSG